VASHDGDCDIEWNEYSGIIKCHKCGKSIHDPAKEIIKTGIKAITALIKGS
jgi:hypothetical protein